MKLIKAAKALWQYLSDPGYRFLVKAGEGAYDAMEDEAFLAAKYQAKMHRPLDLDAPVTFNEKLQYLKLYDRRPDYVTMVDKVAVKDYVASAIGSQYVIPTLGVWEAPEDIDFDGLPEKFALKCSHNSGLGMCICTDKSRLDLGKVKRGLARGLAQDYYLIHREWPYRDVPRRVFAEQFLENDESGLTDYKIHCFNGVPRFVLVCRDRFSGKGLTEDFYTPSWERMALKRPGIPNGACPAPKPEKLEEMLSLAERLAGDIPFVRVDFYYVEGRILFSELTFFPASGFSPFEPGEWDKTFGDWLALPEGRGGTTA